MSVRPAKTQISLGIRPVWWESSLSAWRKFGSLATHWAHSWSESPLGAQSVFLVLSWGGSIVINHVSGPVPHLETTTNAFSCRYCNKLFSRPNHVTKHERIHTGERPYSCEICGKFFTEKGHLTRHERIHTGEKHYVCEICGKTATTRGNLEAHKVVHLNTKVHRL